MADQPRLLWEPTPEAVEASELGRYLAWLQAERGLRFAGYDDLWQWSVDDLDGFWSSIVDYFEVRFHDQPSAVLGSRDMPGAEWFPGGTLNYAEHALRRSDDHPAIVARSQTRGPTTWTHAELRRQVERAAAGLRRLGVGEGDRVASYLPNVPETIVAFLATASIGAVWSSCAPEFGTRSVVDRFRQIEPKVLLAVDGYVYGDKRVDRRPEVAAIRHELPTVTATVVLPYLDPDADLGFVPGHALRWVDLLADHAPLDIQPVPFGHPLWILYSSGTTGLPKPIVQGHGGIVLEHLKALALHQDVGPDDRFFWFTTTGWMMWNFLVSGLLRGGTVVLFDGNPGHPDLDTLWQLAEDEQVTVFGVSAPFILNCLKDGLQPGRDHDLGALRGVGSTGAPLPPEGFEWVYDSVSAAVMLGSVSGGTDVCTAFVGCAPSLPVRAGVIPCRYLGAKVEAFDDDAQPLVGEVGELVITEPMPSMPVMFWGDPDGARLRDAYFAHYPGVWRHGDWLLLNVDGSLVISGRSDATLNRGGVRMGTSDFYSVVESHPAVGDSLVIHLEEDDRLLLFLVPREGSEIDDEVIGAIQRDLRSTLSPRHAADAVHVIPAVPRTLSGKKLEVPVKRILKGRSIDEVASKGAMANPGSLDAFVAIANSG